MKKTYMMKIKQDTTTIEARRCLLLNKIRASGTITSFSVHFGLTPSYVGQLMSGRKLMSTHSAKLMEKRLGLISGVLQEPCDAGAIDGLRPSDLFQDPERYPMRESGKEADNGGLEFVSDPDELAQPTSVKIPVGELRLARLRAIMGRLDVPQFCDYYGFNRRLLNSVINGSKPFPMTLAKKLESKFKLSHGSIVYPDPSVKEEQLLAGLSAIHAPEMFNLNISSSGQSLLGNLTKSLSDGDLSEGQILALAVLLRQFTG